MKVSTILKVLKYLFILINIYLKNKNGQYSDKSRA